MISNEHRKNALTSIPVCAHYTAMPTAIDNFVHFVSGLQVSKLGISQHEGTL